MNKTKFISLAATLGLAIILTLGCEEKSTDKAAVANSPEPTAEEVATQAKAIAEQAEAEAEAKAAAEKAAAEQAEAKAAADRAAAEFAKVEKAAKKVVSCKEGSDVKLLASLTDEKGKPQKKFEYDEQNRIVKIYEYGDGKLYSIETIAYSGDDLISVEEINNREMNVYKYVIKGNTITEKGYTYNINKDGYLVSLKDDSRIVQEEKNDNIIDVPYREEYQYEDGNLTRVSDNNGDGENFFASSRSYNYDDKKSPFSNSTTPKWLLQHLIEPYHTSKSNVIELHSGGGDYAETWAYKYEYDKDEFPIKQTGKLDLNGGDNISGGPTQTITHYTYCGGGSDVK